jgi:hypothetical protein
MSAEVMEGVTGEADWKGVLVFIPVPMLVTDVCCGSIGER